MLKDLYIKYLRSHSSISKSLSFLTRPWRPAVNFPQYFHLESSTLTLLIKIASFFFLPAIQPQHMGSEKKYKHQLNLGCNRAAETITRELLGINENEAKFSFVCSDGYYRRGPGPDHEREKKQTNLNSVYSRISESRQFWFFPMSFDFNLWRGVTTFLITNGCFFFLFYLTLEDRRRCPVSRRV